MPARGFLFISVAATAWGTGGAVAALLYRTSGLGPIAVSWWRFAIGVTILGAVLAVRRPAAAPAPHRGRRCDLVLPVRCLDAPDRERTRRRRGKRDLVVIGVGLAVYQTAFCGAVAYIGLAVATVVTLGAGPVLIAFGARVTLGERLGRSGTAAVSLALAGLVLLAGGSGGAGTRPALGVALSLLSATGYAAVTLLTRARRTAARPYETALAGFAVGGVCLLPFALAEGLGGPYTAGTVGWLLYLGAVPSALAYGLFFAGLTHVRAATASVVALLEPVVAAVIAVALLGERLSAAAVAGTVVLLGAVAALVATESAPATPARNATPAPDDAAALNATPAPDDVAAPRQAAAEQPAASA
ncbi:DMT family transporter [Phytohabitans sp. ZYX-F-186]|uniref:DMT family transporter n=1 Tax=Phytohabitans maris TaxID=3071409 RepID=A0ABU0ZHE0_9ACTN|nr:DMT family transporter [Phytohabitans sp. ZYX-F-186]MDQ7906478.1 DMT family transporter [Phytohabitans sp. ZYX-F-186]